jgi:hypothetical protein
LVPWRAADTSSTGGLTIELELSDGTQIEEVTYSITGGDMLPMVGTIDTSAPGSAASVEIYGIPGGGPYAIMMTATSADDGFEYCDCTHTVDITCVDGDGGGGAGGSAGEGGAGGMGGEGGMGGMTGTGGMGGMTGTGGMGGTGGGGECIPDGGGQYAGAVENRICGEVTCGAMEVCVDQVCTPSAMVFVSSSWSTADLDGPRGADRTCAILAQEARLGGYWMSWTSDPCTSPFKRFERSTLPYRLIDGVEIASSWQRLINRPPDEFYIEHPIDLDEYGEFPVAVDEDTGLETDERCVETNLNDPFGCFVWTNTMVDGKVQAFMDHNGCLGLTTDDSINSSSAVGLPTTIGRAWTDGQNRTCGQNGGRLFCFEQSVADPIP